MLASISHEALCNLISDLDSVMKRRQLQLSSSAYTFPYNAEHLSVWSLKTANDYVFVSGDYMDPKLADSMFLTLARKRKAGLETMRMRKARLEADGKG